jgi:hypothetical protein
MANNRKIPYVSWLIRFHSINSTVQHVVVSALYAGNKSLLGSISFGFLMSRAFAPRFYCFCRGWFSRFMRAMLARVTLEIALRKEFDYAIPLELAGQVAVGSRVKVPFGPRQVCGVVTGMIE